MMCVFVSVCAAIDRRLVNKCKRMTSPKIKYTHDQFKPNSRIQFNQFEFPFRPNLSAIFQHESRREWIEHGKARPTKNGLAKGKLETV